ncbi:hypothetical protein B0H11DRAFT_635384 [Mycena galericulata]|nr:hypothetical protein B0H11DRAFT_635384 [Mycena galericulata]
MSTIMKAEPWQPEDRRLPFELERAIFEMAALSRPVHIPKLMLVAWRVKNWVEPFLYRVIFLCDLHRLDSLPRFTLGVLLRAIDKMPPGFFHDSVRSLFLADARLLQGLDTQDHRAAEKTILSACTGLTDFVTTSRRFLHESILQNLPLKHLSLHLDAFFTDRADFSRPVFRHVTHLEILGSVAQRGTDEWAGLALMPHLTHFAFNDYDACVALNRVLRTCDRLQCFVLIGSATYHFYDREHVTTRRSGIIEDERFVMVAQRNFFTDWQLGAVGRPTYWTFAERFIAAKREGRVDRLEYHTSENTHLTD